MLKLLAVAELSQCLAHKAFKKGLFIVGKSFKDNLMLDALVLDCMTPYHDYNEDFRKCHQNFSSLPSLMSSLAV